MRNSKKALDVPGANKRQPVLLALGANVRGPWGAPRTSLDKAIHQLPSMGISVLKKSDFYLTKPIGYVRQPWYLNVVLCVFTDLPPATMLRRLKLLERQAGRTLPGHWGPRPLDIDILDYCGAQIRSKAVRTRGIHLVLPHPGIATRGFVLVPLAAVAPEWRHPILGLSARQLLLRSPRLGQGVLKA